MKTSRRQFIRTGGAALASTALFSAIPHGLQAGGPFSASIGPFGCQMVYHNHHFEFEEIDGQLIYDVLLEELDPDLVKMQFQVAVIDKGFKAEDYFRKYPGRFISAHLADYSTELEEQVAVGQGIVNWEDLFKAAKEGGVKNYFVEMDPATFEESAKYLLEH